MYIQTQHVILLGKEGKERAVQFSHLFDRYRKLTNISLRSVITRASIERITRA